VRAGSDPYRVLGVAPGATDAAIHAGYRAAVRRAHPDAGGSAGEFEEVQEAYELLRDPARRRTWDAGHARPRAAGAPPPRARQPVSSTGGAAARRAMQDLLAESQRLEEDARKLAGMRPRTPTGAADDEPQDSIAAVLHDAGQQLRTAAVGWTRELSRLARRLR